MSDEPRDANGYPVDMSDADAPEMPAWVRGSSVATRTAWQALQRPWSRGDRNPGTSRPDLKGPPHGTR